MSNTTTAAIEAAAKALEGHWVGIGFRDEAGDDAYESGTLDLDERREIATKAVKAAAPFLTQPSVDSDAIDVAHIERQRDWAIETFGPGRRTLGVLAHIRKELDEIQADPDDLTEWCDVVILAFDGALRHGHEPAAIIAEIKAKQARNEARQWPDWRGRSENEAIEHVRDEEDH